MDNYKPDKLHGIIFKEFIYSPDKVYSTFSISLLKKEEEDINSYLFQSQLLQSKKTKLISPVIKTKYVDLSDKIRVILEIFKDDELLYSESGFNHIIVKNILLEGIPFIDPESTDKNDKKVKDKTLKKPKKEKCTYITYY